MITDTFELDQQESRATGDAKEDGDVSVPSAGEEYKSAPRSELTDDAMFGDVLRPASALSPVDTQSEANDKPASPGLGGS